MNGSKRQPAIRVDADGTVSLAPTSWVGVRVIVPQPGRTSAKCVNGAVVAWEHSSEHRVYHLQHVDVGDIHHSQTIEVYAETSSPSKPGGNPL